MPAKVLNVEQCSSIEFTETLGNYLLLKGIIFGLWFLKFGKRNLAGLYATTVRKNQRLVFFEYIELSINIGSVVGSSWGCWQHGR